MMYDTCFRAPHLHRYAELPDTIPLGNVTSNDLYGLRVFQVEAMDLEAVLVR